MVKNLKLFYSFLIVCTTLVQCTQKPEKKNQPINKVETTVKEKKTIVKESKRFIKDTITQKNCIAFFKEYGKQNKENKVLISTRLGDITIQLYNDTPNHRASFIYLCKIGYFDTTSFYRVVPGFIVQAGNSDKEITSLYKSELENYVIPAEFKSNHKHKRGVIAAARSWVNNPYKNTTPFEFYFIQATKDQSHLDFEHTVFGEIISGIEVIDKIAAEKIDAHEWPENEIRIKTTVLN